MSRNLRDELNLIKKASLHFDLIKCDEDTTPKLDTYFGGKPYITQEKEITKCQICKKKMQFVAQFLIPERAIQFNSLYSFYYCFECANSDKGGSYAVNIYQNPTLERMKTDSKYESVIPYCEVQFSPSYEIPDWDYLAKVFPEFHRKFELLYGSKAMDAYAQAETRVKEFFEDTGFKYKGYPEVIRLEDIPICPKTGVPMEPFLHMESAPEINMVWGKKNALFILFKSPTDNIFDMRTINFEEVEEYSEEDEYDESDTDDEEDDLLGDEL